ncbi:MAG: ribosomal-protein-alanine N-acetyltransferase [Natronomonas sp.]|uniref:ribosomal protein S18-alanine N-acetyltransferase n=1 Tax=Natronomonas sp. TaxID=2184060 RepID=UPI0039898112
MTATGPKAEVAVREATRADLLKVFRIEKQSFPQPWPYAAFERFLDTPGFLIAEDADIVGYVVADSIPNHGTSIGHIKDLAVAPNRRGEGIGRLLLSRALSALFVDGADRVKLEVRESNGTARSLYEAFDFEIHHIVPNYYDDGEDAYVMVREA